MPVDIDLTIESDPVPSMTTLVRGGLRIRVDDQRINAYTRETTEAWEKDWYPEYVGEMPLITLKELFQTARAMLNGDISLYESHRSILPETSDAFVCEYLGGKHLRIAFQTPGRDTNLATPQAACGTVIPVDSFATELVDCGEEVEDTLDRFGLNDSDAESFRTHLQELQIAVDSQ